jgi:hypothetical protein
VLDLTFRHPDVQPACLCNFPPHVLFARSLGGPCHRVAGVVLNVSLVLGLAPLSHHGPRLGNAGPHFVIVSAPIVAGDISAGCAVALWVVICTNGHSEVGGGNGMCWICCVRPPWDDATTCSVNMKYAVQGVFHCVFVYFSSEGAVAICSPFNWALVLAVRVCTFMFYVSWRNRNHLRR